MRNPIARLEESCDRFKQDPILLLWRPSNHSLQTYVEQPVGGLRKLAVLADREIGEQFLVRGSEV